jgi:uncharacterized protein (DUF1778 family)
MPSSNPTMRRVRIPKRERLEARVSLQLKELIQEAADLMGVSLTDFITLSAQRSAEETIRTYRVISLSAQDSQRFAEALLDPGPPNETLRAAFARQDEDVVSIYNDPTVPD